MKRWTCGMSAVLIACGGASSDGEMATGALEPVRSDSAGVVLLRHDTGALDRAPRITLDEAPLAEIRGSAEDEAADISTITPMHFLADGRLVGRDRQRQVLVLFGADGMERQEFGRKGAGPGEYGGLGGVTPASNGTLLVQDFRNGRISVFDPATGPGAEYPLADAIGAGGSSPVGMIDGKIMMYGMNFGSGELDAGPPGIKAVLYDPATGQARRLFTTGPEEQEDDGPRMMGGPGGMMMAVRAVAFTPLQAFPTVFALDGQYVVADGNRFRMEWRDTTGALRTVLSVMQPRRPVTDEVWNAHITEMIGQMTGAVSSGGDVTFTMAGGGTPDTAAMRREMLGQPHADSLPSFEKIQVSNNGTMWVLDYPVPGQDGWAATAFAADGRIIGRIVEPTGEAPVVFGDDRMAFRSEDDLGIATITIRKFKLP